LIYFADHDHLTLADPNAVNCDTQRSGIWVANANGMRAPRIVCPVVDQYIARNSSGSFGYGDRNSVHANGNVATRSADSRMKVELDSDKCERGV